MTITPTPEQEEIVAAAIQTGLIENAEDALKIGVETLKAQLATQRHSETPEEWIARFHAWMDSHAWQTAVLSDEAMSRESIYADRGL
ncbi:MAG: hypothetical protein ABSF22_07045 [Bryobacteraceae bacterium]|jgi:hypothetical protein